MLRVYANPGRQEGGFSLLELILVMAVLGVLAAIALPHLGRGSSGANDAALEADLEALRKAIDLFAAEHHGRYPSADVVAAQLTEYTDMQGHVRAAKDATHIYGPYLHAIPPLPVGHRKGGTRIALADADGVGWIYTPESGLIRANTDLQEVSATAIEH
jgi:prepilin-type N-terminal cleavage/methylation domain-containing protein